MIRAVLVNEQTKSFLSESSDPLPALSGSPRQVPAKLKAAENIRESAPYENYHQNYGWFKIFCRKINDIDILGHID